MRKHWRQLAAMAVIALAVIAAIVLSGSKGSHKAAQAGPPTKTAAPASVLVGGDVTDPTCVHYSVNLVPPSQ